MPRLNEQRRKRSQPLVHMRREAHRQLWAASANLPSIPKKFSADKTYRIKLTKVVKPADFSQFLRPDQDVQVKGNIAEEIREFISGAVVVAG